MKCNNENFIQTISVKYNQHSKDIFIKSLKKQNIMYDICYLQYIKYLF